MEWFKQTAEQLGSIDKYPVLIKLFDDLKMLDDKPKKKMFKYISMVNECSKAETSKASPYVYKLIRNDFKAKLKALGEAYDLPADVVSRADCYTNTKFRTSIIDKTPFEVRNRNENI